VKGETGQWGWVGGGPSAPLRRAARRNMNGGGVVSGAGDQREPDQGAVVADEPGRKFRTPYNVVADFRHAGAARLALRVLGERGVPREAMTLDDHSAGDSDEEVAALRAEMQDELGESWASPAVLMTENQARGAFWGTMLTALAFMVAGLVAGVVWAVSFRTGPPAWARIISLVLVSGAAGGTIGFLVGGGLAPRLDALNQPSASLDDVTPEAERDVLLAVHSDDRLTVESAAEVLARLGADRVALVDADGTPLPPQKAHPRPADPPGWWWKRAGRG
jgi:hypothetical protein